jgi:putative NADH-flavin reductase
MKILVIGATGFPAVYRAEALAHHELLVHFRTEVAVLGWTSVTPAAQIAPGTRTGTFRAGDDRLLTAPDGTSFISAEDYAVALMDQVESGDALRRITVAY